MTSLAGGAPVITPVGASVLDASRPAARAFLLTGVLPVIALDASRPAALAGVLP